MSLRLFVSIPAAAACLLVLFAASTTLHAQGPGPVPAPRPLRPASVPIRPLRASGTSISPLDGVVPQDPAAAAAMAAGQDPAAAKEAAATSARLMKWKQLLFDRRPSTILQAWAAPELKPYDPAEEKKTDAAGAPGEPAPAAPAAAGAGALSKAEMEELLLRQFGGESSSSPAVPGANAVHGDPANPAAPGAPAMNAELQLAEKKLQREMEMLQRDVTMSRWHKVAEFLQTIVEKERKGAYEHFLKVLPNHPPGPQDQRVPPNLQEKNRFAFEEVFVLAALAPGGFDKKQVPMMAPIVRRAIENGCVTEELMRLLAAEIGRPETEQRLDRREAALLLAAVSQEVEMGPFLPTAEEAEKANDREALNLLARHALAMFDKDKHTKHLEAAWRATHAALAKGEISDEDKADALRRAVELAPKIREDLGPAWLETSFTERPERGMEIIATIGGQAAKGFQDRSQDATYRAKGLALQKSAVEALLKVAPQLAEQWRPTLGLLASTWIVEASWSYANSQSDSFGPMMQRDDFGNIFYGNMRRGGGGQVAAVEPVDLIASQPGPAWAAQLGPALEPHFATVCAQIYLKVNEEQRAFPFIEQLASTNPRKAKELVSEFLRVWIRNHNPNRGRTNSYMYMYGFESRANGIPLTRSKQERNLEELGSWVERLRKLPIGGVDEKLLVEAFVTAHSSAEVYRIETIERVFGDVSELDPVLLGEALGKMRTNLATVWRVPAVQEQNKTKRSEREMLDEVKRGYETAMQIASKAMSKRGEHWALLAVTASILHDMNNFSKERQRDSGFADARKAAFALFEKGADHYIANAADLRTDQETLGAFDAWFYAAVGACDLGAIDEETVVAKSQLPRIKAAIERLPAGSRERHMSMFANAMFTRMSAVKPQIKHRYLESGFAIVGDHPQAIEARKVFDYYEDLTRELRLDAVVEGPTEVGTKPFGVRVDLVHSPQIERESGGFAKYAMNQNNMSYAYNYGRPLENYRDRFQEAVNSALNEHFEVLSVTWNGEKMSSLPTAQPEWRHTPYAYLLLKARGPQVDRIPAIQIDFDFLDTSGYAVLPIGSAVVPIDASRDAATVRPYQSLTVTQILDERRADEGKVTLEIKALAHGLVPALEDFLTLDTPGFKIDKRDDQGASVMRFADDQNGVMSERVWLLSLVPAESGAVPRNFVFGKPSVDGITAVYQRYADADLETVSAEVALGGHRSSTSIWLWIGLGGALLGYGMWFFMARPGRGDGPAVALLHMPRVLTPFSVLDLLRQVEKLVRLDEPGKQQLAAAIRRVEERHFGRAEDPTLDLKAVAEEWLRRAG